MQSQPLVSIFCFCKDRAASIRRCIESVLTQSYRNIEFVIQDGASTDGTLEIIRSFKDERIKLVSAPDSGPNEGFWKVLNRCEGDIIGSCLSDEELLPGAIEEAVALFARHPHLGAVTRDGYNTDAGGKITGEFIAGDFDFVDYLFGRYCPMWAASFFSRQALLEIGLRDGEWTMGCIEFEMWCRLATRHHVRYFPGKAAKYAVDAAGQLSNSPRHFDDHLDNRTKIIGKLFSEDGFFGHDPIKKAGCLYNQNFLFYNHARAYRMFDAMKRIYARIAALEATLGPAAKEYSILFSDFLATSSADSAAVMQQRAAAYGKAFQSWAKLATRAPKLVRNIFSAEQRAAIRRLGLRTLFGAYDLLTPKRKPDDASTEAGTDEDAMYGLAAPIYSKRLYHEVAMLYYGRGNIDYAQLLWSKAEAAHDATIDGLAVQAALFSPTATNESLLAAQKRWAARHAKPIPGIGAIQSRPYKGDRKIRVGYYCSFLDSDVFRAMFAPVAAAHDRERFTCIGYSPTPVAKHLQATLDETRTVGTMPDRDFVNLVRADAIDIFVEMSGFSPMHRFAAMASRCAPIQIAHFNHSGTCGVPNVDYVFADAMSVLPAEEQYYSEKVWRLEGDFLFFSYEWANLPEPRDPPSLEKGFVTFGCFGTAAKLSDQVIELWAQVLRAVPGSMMYVRNGPLGRKVNRDYLAQRFARYGIDESRLRLEGATDWVKFIGSYGEVDISLDTWPYCGANTIGESVWSGVPAISLRGERFSGRYGSSHLAAAGIPELIAQTPQQYVDVAARLAASPERLVHYRRNLRRMAKEHGLSDPVRFARKLEKSYERMMQILHGSAS